MIILYNSCPNGKSFFDFSYKNKYKFSFLYKALILRKLEKLEN